MRTVNSGRCHNHPIKLASFCRIYRKSQRWLIVFICNYAVWNTILLSASTTVSNSIEQALVVDYDTGAVLLEKNADALMHPSSMSKLMTLYMVFERLRAGDLSFDDTFLVNERAWRMGGSKMFVALNSRVPVSDLLHGIIVQSANDACVVVAENLASSERIFAEAMTAKARLLGLSHSTFRNASGWPVPDHLMTARDLVTLARRLITDFPEYYPLFKELYFTYNGIRQGNRNPLLYKPELGADGLKTGHTEAGGYGLIVSAFSTAERRRVLMVLNGLANTKRREQESERLIKWSLRAFRNHALFEANAEVANASVLFGTQDVIPLVTDKAIVVTLPRDINQNIRATVVFDSPIPAPIVKGEHLATLVITTPGVVFHAIPLLAGINIEKLSFSGRLLETTRGILWGGPAN